MSRQIDAAMFVDLESANGGELSAKRFSPERLIKLAEEDFDAKLRVAAAYADFRYYQQFIEVLHLTGFEPVQVTGYRPGQQSVDMKMCCDILSVAFERPDITMFIILANDTDYVPLVRVLRKLGRSVFLLCKKSEAIEQAYGTFCDRIVDYGMLIEDSSAPSQIAEPAASPFQDGTPAVPSTRKSTGSIGRGPPAGDSQSIEPAQRSEHEVGVLLRRAQDTLKELLAEYPGGMLGAQLLPQLRRKLDMPSFDFSDVGYGSALKFVRSMQASDVRVTHDGRPDFLVVMAEGKSDTTEDKIEWAKRNSAIKEYAFTSDREYRDRLVSLIFAEGRSLGTFTRKDIIDRIQGEHGNFSRGVIDKYLSLFYQMKAFNRVSEDSPARFEFVADLDDVSVVERFEVTLTYKVLFALNRAGRLEDWGADEQLALFELPDDAEQRARANRILAGARTRLDSVLAEQGM